MGFDPDSTRFSYGSNLNQAYFEAKMRKLNSALTLIDIKNGVLYNFERSLDNESSRHGLGYEIRCKEGKSVEGILHLVPVENLGKFLRREGVANGDNRESKPPSYKVIHVAVQSRGHATQALTLEGNKLRKGDEKRKLAMNKEKELEEYIRASSIGARTRELNDAPFRADLEWLASLQKPL